MQLRDLMRVTNDGAVTELSWFDLGRIKYVTTDIVINYTKSKCYIDHKFVNNSFIKVQTNRLKS